MQAATLADPRGLAAAMEETAVEGVNGGRVRTTLVARGADSVEPVVVFCPATAAPTIQPFVAETVQETATAALLAALRHHPFVVFIADFPASLALAADPMVSQEAEPFHTRLILFCSGQPLFAGCRLSTASQGTSGTPFMSRLDRWFKTNLRVPPPWPAGLLSKPAWR
jgi:hypothetical protein